MWSDLTLLPSWLAWRALTASVSPNGADRLALNVQPLRALLGRVVYFWSPWRTTQGWRPIGVSRVSVPTMADVLPFLPPDAFENVALYLHVSSVRPVGRSSAWMDADRLLARAQQCARQLQQHSRGF